MQICINISEDVELKCRVSLTFCMLFIMCPSVSINACICIRSLMIKGPTGRKINWQTTDVLAN